MFSNILGVVIMCDRIGVFAFGCCTGGGCLRIHSRGVLGGVAFVGASVEQRIWGGSVEQRIWGGSVEQRIWGGSVAQRIWGGLV